MSHWVRNFLRSSGLSLISCRPSDKIRSVTVTCAPIVAVACSAQIEYFEDHVASTANVEWFDPALHQPSYAQEIVYHGAHIPSSAEVEYFDSDVAETVEESSFSISSESAGFSSVDISSTETGYDFPLSESGSAVAPQNSVTSDGKSVLSFSMNNEY